MMVDPASSAHCIHFVRSDKHKHDIIFPIFRTKEVIPIPGRAILQLFMPAGQLHELYTFACGLYTLWAATRLLTLLYNWAVQGLAQFYNKVLSFS